MKEHYGNDVVVRLQGTSWDILFCNVSEATTTLALSTKRIGMDAGFQQLFSPRTALPLYKQYSNNIQRWIICWIFDITENKVLCLFFLLQQKVEVNNEGGAGRRSAILRIKNLHNNVDNDMNIVTPEMLFNIFSLYGHVVKIKLFLKMQRREDQN